MQTAPNRHLYVQGLGGGGGGGEWHVTITLADSL